MCQRTRAFPVTIAAVFILTAGALQSAKGQSTPAPATTPAASSTAGGCPEGPPCPKDVHHKKKHHKKTEKVGEKSDTAATTPPK